MPFKVDYKMIRSLIQDGDFMLCYGEALMSEAIEFITGECSHVGLLERIRDRVMVLEAVNEFRHYPLSNYFTNYNNSGKRYPGRIFIGRPRSITPQAADQMLDLAYADLGKAYDWSSVLKIGYNETLGKIFPAFETDDRQKLFCSEACNYYYMTAGCGQFKQTNEFITPHDIATSPEMNILYEVIF